MKNNFRDLLSKLHFSFSTGYGRTFYQHQYHNFLVYQNQQQSTPLFFLPPYPSSINADFAVNSDTAAINFSSKGFNVPLKLSIHVEIQSFIIGAGISYEYMRVDDFQYKRYADNFETIMANNRSFARRYFLLLGKGLAQYNDYSFIADINVGLLNLGNPLGAGFYSRGPYANLGLNIQKDLSEYFKLFIRPSVEWKSRNYNLSFAEDVSSIRHFYPSVFLNFGAVLRIPELRRCRINNCHAQVDHRHGNLVVRSRMHPIYKKQNPFYGENYPRLIRYKWRNKNKLNPY